VNSSLEVEKNILDGQLHRARQLGLSATLTLKQWSKTVAYFNGLCAYCLDKPYTVLEHFIPLLCGGGTTYDNCVPACQSCNVLKGKYHPLSIPDIPSRKALLQNIASVRAYLELCKQNIEVQPSIEFQKPRVRIEVSIQKVPIDDLTVKRTTVYLEEEDIAAIEQIKQQYGVKTDNAAVRLALRSFSKKKPRVKKQESR
jgi:HNH endonuclease